MDTRTGMGFCEFLEKASRSIEGIFAELPGLPEPFAQR